MKHRLPVLAAIVAALLAVGAVGWLLLDGTSPFGSGDGEAREDADAAEGGLLEAEGEDAGGPTLQGAPLRTVDLSQSEGDAAAAAAAAAAGVDAAALARRVDLVGVVRDAAGRPAAGVRVAVFGEVQGESVTVEATTDAQGRFRTKLPYGRYDLLLTSGTGGLLVSDFLLDAGALRETVFTLEAVGRVDVEVLRGGEPVVGAHVSLLQTTASARVVFPGTSTTSGAGTATLDSVPKGSYVVSVAAGDGWIAEQRFQVAGDTTVKIAAPAVTLLSGRVLDADAGTPVEKAVVVVEARQGKETTLRGSGVSGFDGTYTLAAPRQAPSLITVEAEGYAPWPRVSELGPVLRRIRASLARGTPTTLDVPLVRGASVSGKVTEETGAPVRALVLRFADVRGRVELASTSEDGRYAVGNLNPGRYVVSVGTEGWFPKAPLEVRIPNDGAAQTYDIVLLRARTVEGVVLHGAGTPASGARVYVAGGSGILRSARDSGRFLETFTADDGTWRVADVPSDKSVWFRATLGPLEATPVLSRAGIVSTEPVRLVLEATGTIRGAVVDAGSRQRIPGATVKVDPAGDPPVRGSRTTTTDANGEYVVEGLIAGDWWLTPVKGKEYLPAEHVVVKLTKESKEASEELRLDPGLVFEGSVLDDRGRSLSGAMVTVQGTPDQGSSVSRSATTDLRGDFRITGFSLGTYRAVARLAGYRVASLENLRGGETRLRLVLVAVP